MEQFTVRQLRASLDLSVVEMAQKMKMDPNTYRNKEKGISKWYLDEWQRLSIITGIALDKIIL